MSLRRWPNCGQRAVGIILLIFAATHSAPASGEGSIAYATLDGRLLYGVAANKATAREAAQEAARGCHPYCSSADAFRQFSMTCAALASTSTASVVATSLNDDSQQAERNAVKACEDPRMGGCKVVASLCDHVSERLKTAADRLTRQRGVLLFKHGVSSGSPQVCDLAGKTIKYSYRVCANEQDCRSFKGRLEPESDKIGYRDESQDRGLRFPYSVGKTMTFSTEPARLPVGQALWTGAEQGSTKVYITAAYDGPELALLMDFRTEAKSHSRFPDGTLLVVGAVEERIRLPGCGACELGSVQIEAQAVKGPDAAKTVSDRGCEMGSK